MNHGSGTEGYLATPTHAGLFRGNVQVTGNVQVASNVQVTGTIEAGPGATGTPLAYATVSSAGDLGNKHTANVQSVTKVGTGTYEILISGAQLATSNAVAVVTPYGPSPALATFSFGIGGTLLVAVYSTSGVLQDKPFSFVIYR